MYLKVLSTVVIDSLFDFVTCNTVTLCCGGMLYGKEIPNSIDQKFYFFSIFLLKL